MTPLNVIFMGTPAFSVPPLNALIKAGHRVVAVYSQPPRPAGRGETVKKRPVHLAAEQHGIPVHTPTSFKDAQAVQTFQSHQADIAVVVAYGLILPKSILSSPSMGCVNIHGSLLPRWRGAAPIQRAIEAGDAESGITIMQMDEGLDTGDMLMSASLPLTADTTGASLHDGLSLMGATLIVEALEGLCENTLTPIPQPAEGVTYAKKLTRQESMVDWSQPASVLERKVRAFTPWPGVYFLHDGKRIKILEARVEPSNGSVSPGTLMDDTLQIACGEGSLRITHLQKEGKAPMDAKAFLNGTPLLQGTGLT